MITIPRSTAVPLYQEEEPWIVQYTLPASGPNPIIHLFLRQAENPGSPITGLSDRSNRLAFCLLPEDGRPAPLKLTDGPAHEDVCGFREIDPGIMPGLYKFEVPHRMRGPGRTFIYLSFQNTCPKYIEINGVNYNPYDSFALGLENWVRASCHENLSSGLRQSMPAVMHPLLAEWRTRREKV